MTSLIFASESCQLQISFKFWKGFNVLSTQSWLIVFSC
jgi:hypothetical protein